MKKRIYLILICCTVVVLLGCTLEALFPHDKQVMIMTYNVQNLFDPYVNGNEYPEYTPEQGWSAQAYRQRLQRTASAVTQGHKLVPTIILFQEIENILVLQDLVSTHLSRHGFYQIAATNDADSPIQVGIASCYPITEVRIHAVKGSRSILECRLDINGSDLVIFNLHAKSRIGGVEETESQRRATAAAVTYRVKELLTYDPFLPIIVGGDFNESADAAIREPTTFDHALVPLQLPEAYRLGQEGSFVLSGEAPSENSWYTCWLDRKALLSSAGSGSYLYNGVWESFDQLLLNSAFFDRFGLEYHSAVLGSHSPLVDTKGRPVSYDLKTGQGYSDHLPVAVILSLP
ncbi:MAG: endonuclease/exonuclease/phosphatase family protein [Sphaerochaetaceae bacterium]